MIPNGILDVTITRKKDSNLTVVNVVKAKARESSVATDDSLEINQVLINAEASSIPPDTVPELVEFKTKVWYDENLLEKFDGDHDRTQEYAAIVVQNMQMERE